MPILFCDATILTIDFRINRVGDDGINALGIDFLQLQPAIAMNQRGSFDPLPAFRSCARNSPYRLRYVFVPPLSQELPVVALPVV